MKKTEQILAKNIFLVENILGNPFDETNIFSFKNILALDEREEYPHALVDALDDAELYEIIIPPYLGGDFHALENVFTLLKSLARRDITLTIAYGGGKFMGTVSFWVAGNIVMQEKITEFLRNKKKLAFGLSERNHGSDLLNNEVGAIADDESFYINGEKWTIGHGNLGDAIMLFTRTEHKGGWKGFSLLFIEKNESNIKHIEHLPKIKTIGVRGIDLSGFRLNNVEIPSKNIIGEEGKGLEYIVKILQINRLLIGAIPIGGADTALRLVLRFVFERNLFGEAISEIPIIQEKLNGMFKAIIAADCFSMVVARCFHEIPNQCLLLSAISKAIIPDLINEYLVKIGQVLGARSYIRNETDYAIFQKIYRDLLPIPIVEGNTDLNLQNILIQLKIIASRRHKYAQSYANYLPVFVQIFDFSKELTKINFQKLEISNGDKDILILTLYYVSEELFKSKQHPKLYEVSISLIKNLEKLDMLIIQDEAQLSNVFSIPSHLFYYARRYSMIHIASAILCFWFFNRTNKNAFTDSPELLQGCLEFLLSKITADSFEQSDSRNHEHLVFDFLRKRYENNQTFDLIPIQLPPF